MPETAATQLNRLVQLVAELSRREERGERALSLARLAQDFATTPAQILRDIRVLTETTDDPEGTWLASLTVVQEADRVEISSRGPYRRPIRLTAEELLALQVALVTEGDTPSAAVRELAGLAELAPEAQLAPVPFVQGDEAAAVSIARLAMNQRRCLNILYAGEGADSARARAVEPHDLVYAEGAFYLVAWCRDAKDWRRFRADRVVDAEILPDGFEARPDLPRIERAQDVFRAPVDSVVEMSVRFSPAISRWLKPATLRQQFILTEVFQPPLGMREERFG